MPSWTLGVCFSLPAGVTNQRGPRHWLSPLRFYLNRNLWTKEGHHLTLVSSWLPTLWAHNYKTQEGTNLPCKGLNLEIKLFSFAVSQMSSISFFYLPSLTQLLYNVQLQTFCCISFPNLPTQLYSNSPKSIIQTFSAQRKFALPEHVPCCTFSKGKKAHIDFRVTFQILKWCHKTITPEGFLLLFAAILPLAGREVVWKMRYYENVTVLLIRYYVSTLVRYMMRYYENLNFFIHPFMGRRNPNPRPWKHLKALG